MFCRADNLNHACKDNARPHTGQGKCSCNNNPCCAVVTEFSGSPSKQMVEHLGLLTAVNTRPLCCSVSKLYSHTTVCIVDMRLEAKQHKVYVFRAPSKPAGTSSGWDDNLSTCSLIGMLSMAALAMPLLHQQVWLVSVVDQV